MKIAIYPGSFSPLHEGHIDVISKALGAFDKVIVAQGINPDKDIKAIYLPEELKLREKFNNRVDFVQFYGLLKDFIDPTITAVVKGIRNIQDFEYEKNQQYWNEDLGITIPTFYVISNRSLCHISSSALRAIKNIKENS